MTWIILGIVITLILSAIFSGMEIAFFSAGKLSVEVRKNRSTRRGSIIADFYDNPNDFLSTMLVGNNIALVIFSSLMGLALSPFFDPFFNSIAPSWMPELLIKTIPLTIVTTIIVLIFGEFLPKLFFRLFATKILFFFAYPIAFFKWILTPFSWSMVRLSEKVLRLFVKHPPEETEDAFTRLDLAKFVESTSIGNDNNDLLDKEMFSNVLDMKQTRVRNCMIPRTEIKAVEVTDSVEELRELFIESNLSKIIVYKESIDDVIGYVHHQYLLDKPKNIKGVMRKIPIIPETMRINNLMNLFTRERISIACVVDEFGGTSGIITLEDILEEIFGEIEDEHDIGEEQEEQISDYEYLFSGRLEIDYLNEKYEYINFPEGEYHTLSGYIVMTTGTIPEKDQVIDIGDGYKFILEMVSETKIESVRVIKLMNHDTI